MAYQTGTATSVTDLLDKLRIWMVAGGWTQNHDAVDATGRRVQLSKSGMFCNFRSFIAESSKYFGNASQTPTTHAGIALICGTGYSAVGSWENQAGVPLQAVGTERLTMVLPMNIGAISAYHFFADATFDNIIVVTRRSAGVYSTLFWGVSLTKINTWTGGMYFGASRMGNTINNTFSNDSSDGGLTTSAACPGSTNTNNASGVFIRADVDTFVGKWGAVTMSTSTSLTTGRRLLSPVGTTSVDDGKTTGVIDYGQGYNGSASPAQLGQRGLQGAATSLLNNGAVLLPVSFWAELDSALGWAFMGWLPNIFACNSQGHASESVYSISTDDYMIFPNFAVKKIP